MLYDNLLIRVDGFETVENSKEIFKEGAQSSMFLLDLERDIWTKVPKECLINEDMEIEVLINRQLQVNQIYDNALNIFDYNSYIEDTMNEVNLLLEELLT